MRLASDTTLIVKRWLSNVVREATLLLFQLKHVAPVSAQYSTSSASTGVAVRHSPMIIPILLDARMTGCPTPNPDGPVYNEILAARCPDQPRKKSDLRPGHERSLFGGQGEWFLRQNSSRSD